MSAARCLALAVVLRALRDMQNHGAKITTAPTAKEHLDASVWLGSSRAAVWFEAAEIDQLNVLRDNDWVTYTEAVLKDQELKLEVREMLEDVVKVFGYLKARDDKGL